MNKIFRSVTFLEPEEKSPATDNLGTLNFDLFLDLKTAEKVVLEYILDYFELRKEAPPLNEVITYFHNKALPEEVLITENSVDEQFHEGGDFRHVLEEIVKEQTTSHNLEVKRKGIKVSEDKGPDDGVTYTVENLRTVPRIDGEDDEHDFSKRLDSLKEFYERQKANEELPGVPTGFHIVDDIKDGPGGVKKKWLYLHAGFVGHLKSTIMMNQIVTAATSGWNTLLFTTEHPSVEIEMALIAIHSNKGKFKELSGVPLSHDRMMKGNLTVAEEEFMKEVMKDLAENENHGSIRIYDSGFDTFSSVRTILEREHKREEVDVLWIDYLSRLKKESSFRGNDMEGVNEIIREAKRLAMNFNDGEGLAVCSPVQVNRTGVQRAENRTEDKGRLDISSLASYSSIEREADLITYSFYGTDEQSISEPKWGMLKSRFSRCRNGPFMLHIDDPSRYIKDADEMLPHETFTGLTQDAAAEEIGMSDDEVVI